MAIKTDDDLRRGLIHADDSLYATLKTAVAAHERLTDLASQILLHSSLIVLRRPVAGGGPVAYGLELVHAQVLEDLGDAGLRIVSSHRFSIPPTRSGSGYDEYGGYGKYSGYSELTVTGEVVVSAGWSASAALEVRATLGEEIGGLAVGAHLLHRESREADSAVDCALELRGWVDALSRAHPAFSLLAAAR
jgi:hypothetical protein